MARSVFNRAGSGLFFWRAIGPNRIGLNSWFFALETQFVNAEIATNTATGFFMHRIDVPIPTANALGGPGTAGNYKLRLAVGTIQDRQQRLERAFALGHESNAQRTARARRDGLIEAALSGKRAGII